MGIIFVDNKDKALCDIVNIFAFVFLDENLIFFQTLEKHVDHIYQVLQWFCPHQLFICC